MRNGINDRCRTLATEGPLTQVHETYLKGPRVSDAVQLSVSLDPSSGTAFVSAVHRPDRRVAPIDPTVPQWGNTVDEITAEMMMLISRAPSFEMGTKDSFIDLDQTQEWYYRHMPSLVRKAYETHVSGQVSPTKVIDFGIPKAEWDGISTWDQFASSQAQKEGNGRWIDLVLLSRALVPDLSVIKDSGELLSEKDNDKVLAHVKKNIGSFIQQALQAQLSSMSTKEESTS